jgi:hypothetical protein
VNLFIFSLSRRSAENVQSFFSPIFSMKRISDSNGSAKRTKEALQINETASTLINPAKFKFELKTSFVILIWVCSARFSFPHVVDSIAATDRIAKET